MTLTYETRKLVTKFNPATLMQLEDALVAPKAVTLTGTDLVQVYQVNAHPKGAKVMTVADFIVAAVTSLPTSDVGLDEGDVYLDDGVVTVIQPD